MRRHPLTRSSRSWRRRINDSRPIPRWNLRPRTEADDRRAWLLTVVLLTSPVFHLLALFFDTRWLNFGSRQPFDALVYFIIAPVVGALMLRRHERAIPRSTSSCPARSCVPSESNRGLSVFWRRPRSCTACSRRAVPSIGGPAQGDGAAAPQATHVLRAIEKCRTTEKNPRRTPPVRAWVAVSSTIGVCSMVTAQHRRRHHACTNARIERRGPVH